MWVFTWDRAFISRAAEEVIVEPEKDGQQQEMSEDNEQTLSRWLSFSFDLIICTPGPSWKKVCHPLSHTHFTPITGCAQQSRGGRERGAGARQQPVACVCVSTYFCYNLTLPPDQHCHYGAFHTYREQLSHHEISPRGRSGRPVILPSPHSYYSNTIFRTNTS